MRSLLESAMYAWICAVSEEHRTSWEKRGTGSEERKAARALFAWTRLQKLLKETNADLAERIADEYDQLIAYGAHPNVEGLALSSEIKKLDGDKYEIVTVFTHGRDAVLVAILDLLRCMGYVYGLLELVIKERLQILGLDAEFQATEATIFGLISKLEAELSDMSE